MTDSQLSDQEQTSGGRSHGSRIAYATATLAGLVAAVVTSAVYIYWLRGVLAGEPTGDFQWLIGEILCPVILCLPIFSIIVGAITGFVIHKLLRWTRLFCLIGLHWGEWKYQIPTKLIRTQKGGKESCLIDCTQIRVCEQCGTKSRRTRHVWSKVYTVGSRFSGHRERRCYRCGKTE
jgi:hypothetical protein